MFKYRKNYKSFSVYILYITFIISNLMSNVYDSESIQIQVEDQQGY